ncbi:hypothetical protein [Parafrankia sp. FMc2]|uniref:hypothetical protein n=1 Tax=Parafrankia sp. FMc2 TaxID=3233196 RepID=UPI0034D7885C
MSAGDVPPTGGSFRPARRGRLRGSAAGETGDPGLMGLNLRYFAIRAVLFGGVLAVLLLLGLDGLFGFALALVISGLLSYPLALRQRRAVLNTIAVRRAGEHR